MIKSLAFTILLFHTIAFSQGIFTVETDKDYYDYGEEITVTAKLENNTDNTFTINGSATCICTIRMENIQFDLYCTLDNTDFTFDPGDSRSWIWHLDPEVLFLPGVQGTQIVTAYCDGRVATHEFYGQKYYGGNVQVGYNIQVPDAIIQVIRDSVNAVVLDSDTLESSERIRQEWKLTNLDIDSVAAIYDEDPRLNYMEVRRWGNYSELIYVGITDGNQLPTNIELYQNYPNPFNPSTTITYRIREHEKVSLTIYDISGKLIKRLIDAKQSPGIHSVIFNGNGLSSGTYLCQLKTRNTLQNIKMLLLK
jgi:hypothetical protein